MKFFLIASLCIAAAVGVKVPGSNREGKLFLVSSSTSTTTLTTSSVCFVSTNANFQGACKGRKKRALINKAFNGEVDIDASQMANVR